MILLYTEPKIGSLSQSFYAVIYASSYVMYLRWSQKTFIKCFDNLVVLIVCNRFQGCNKDHV